MSVENPVYVLPSVFGDGPIEPLLVPCGQEAGKRAAELTAAVVRQRDRPVALVARRHGEARLEQIDAPPLDGRQTHGRSYFGSQGLAGSPQHIHETAEQNIVLVGAEARSR